jgi:hypothetical protein
MSANIICDYCESVLPRTSAYCLTPAQVMRSKEFWDYVMLKPNKRQISYMHFIEKSVDATDARGAIVASLVNDPSLWLICESCLYMFDINADLAKKYAHALNEDALFQPPNSGLMRNTLTQAEFMDVTIYAVGFAGHKAFSS